MTLHFLITWALRIPRFFRSYRRSREIYALRLDQVRRLHAGHRPALSYPKGKIRRFFEERERGGFGHLLFRTAQFFSVPDCLSRGLFGHVVVIFTFYYCVSVSYQLRLGPFHQPGALDERCFRG